MSTFVKGTSLLPLYLPETSLLKTDQQTTLAEISSMSSRSKKRIMARHRGDGDEAPELSRREESQTGLGARQEKWIQVYGRAFRIDYSTLENFEKSFTDLIRKTNKKLEKGLKLVLVEMLRRENPQLDAVLGKTVSEYGNCSFQQYESTGLMP